MHLIYLDESGNTGNNLTDQNQPVFVLCALLVPESKWLEVEASLSATLNRFFPDRPDTFEVHANEILNPRGFSGPSRFPCVWSSSRHGLMKRTGMGSGLSTVRS
jgi:hypothetical protein